VEEGAKEPLLFLILDGIEDPHNLGACFRVADAMGVHAIICPKDNAVGVNATVRKVACGGAESVPFIAVTNIGRTIRYLKECGLFIIGTDGETKKNIYQENLSGPIAIVLGSEGKGMRRLTRELCDTLVSIPMLGQVESLNVSVASGICLSEIRRQRTLS
jgi:23S rRNA (guanosine2251-2'-O)-methyltransferase